MKDLVWYELSFPRDLTYEGVLPWVRTLAARQRRGMLGGADPVVFEVHSQGRRMRWFMAFSHREAAALLSHLRTLLPGLRMNKKKTRPVALLRRGVEVRLNTTRRPLRFDEAEASAASLVSALHNVRKDESLVLQWTIGPWLPRPVVKRIGPMKPGVGVERLLLQLAMDSEDATAYRKKLGEPLLGATLRIGVSATDRPRQHQLLQGVLGALQVARQPGVGFVTRWLGSRTVLKRMVRLHRPLIAWPVPVNAAELAATVGWPLGNPHLSGVEYSGHKQLPPAEGTVIQGDPEVLSKHGYRLVGRATYPGQAGLLHLPPQAARHHLLVTGPTGSGKSTLLAGLIQADVAAGRGCVVIDPKGDLVSDVLDRIPQERIEDIVLIDPSDQVRPVGLNVIAFKPQQAEVVVDQVLHVFRELYRDTWGVRMHDVFHAGLLTLARVGGQTLCELATLLTSEGYRRRILSGIDDPLALGPFWSFFGSLSDKERTEVVSPVLNKLRPLTYRRSIRSLLGQVEGFSMSRVFTERKVVLVNLAKGLVGPQAARLLGSLIFSTLWQTALGRAAIEPDKRHVVPVYLDEWQDLLHVPNELGDVLAQARGLGVALTLANQHFGQLPPAVRTAVSINARSFVAFQTPEAESGLVAAKLGGGLQAQDLENLGPFEIYASLMRGSGATPPASATSFPLSPPLGSAEPVRASSRTLYGRDLAEVEAELLARQRADEFDTRLGGRRRRPA